MREKNASWDGHAGIPTPSLVAAPVSARKWTSSDGKFSVEAELVEAKDGNVRLKRQDGKVITVPVSKLSKADREYLSSIAKPEKKPEAAEPTRDEAIAAIEKLGGKVEVDENKAVVSVALGNTKITDAGLNPLPPQQPIPIWFGGHAEAVMRRVARIGDGWFPIFQLDDTGKAELDKFRGYIEEAGRDPADVGIESFNVVAGTTPDQWAVDAKAWKENGAS